MKKLYLLLILCLAIVQVQEYLTAKPDLARPSNVFTASGTITGLAKVADIPQ